MNAMYSNIPKKTKKQKIESNIELHKLINIGIVRIIFFLIYKKKSLTTTW